MLKWWEERGFIEEMSDNVDLEANEQALYTMPILRRRWFTKQVLGMCGVGKNENMGA